MPQSDATNGTAQTMSFRDRGTRFAVVAVSLASIVVSGWYIAQFALQGSESASRGVVRAQSPTGPSGRPGFDLSDAVVDRSEILSGGPPKDGIPALTDPPFVAAAEAEYLDPAERVIGVVIGADARAYPLAILNYHEIVNDNIGDVPLAVTYCPLCDSAAVFDRRTPLGEREFGVSGLLYNSNVLMYDRGEAESLWSQLRSSGISGAGADKRLTALPLELTTWGDWRSRYPQTRVLAADTGHGRDYRRNPYSGYFDSPRLMFPAKPASDQLPVKARVLGVWTDHAARAYPLSAFSRDRATIIDRLDGKQIQLEYRTDADSLRVTQADEGVSWQYAFWFAWYAFHPQTDVFPVTATAPPAGE